MTTGAVGPKVQYSVPKHFSVEPIQEAVDMNYPLIESVLKANEQLIIQEHPLRRDSITIRNKDTGETVAKEYRRGGTWGVVDRASPMPLCKTFTLPGLKKKLAFIPRESIFGFVHKVVDHLDKSHHAEVSDTKP